jgi:hypothetical protein
MKKLIFIILAVSFVFVACGPKPASALPGVKTWMAAWNANTETDLNGYYLYWRTTTGTFSDTNKVMCAKTATTQVLTGIVPNNCILALTAFDVAGNESAFSTEVPFVKDGTAPSSPAGLAVVPVP